MKGHNFQDRRSNPRKVLTHKWSEAGLGKAPFAIVGVAEIPNPSLAEANPTAFNNALAALPKGIGVGSCAVCGTALKLNFIIQDATGKRFVVGSECVKKAGDSKLDTELKIETRARNRSRAMDRRQAAMKARIEKARWERLVKSAEFEAQNWGVSETQVKMILSEAREALRLELMDILSAMAFDLRDGRKGFRDSVARDMEHGRLPSGRGRGIVQEILAKRVGRKNSEAFKAEHKRIGELLDKAEEIANQL